MPARTLYWWSTDGVWNWNTVANWHTISGNPTPSGDPGAFIRAHTLATAASLPASGDTIYILANNADSGGSADAPNTIPTVAIVPLILDMTCCWVGADATFGNKISIANNGMLNLGVPGDATYAHTWSGGTVGTNVTANLYGVANVSSAITGNVTSWDNSEISGDIGGNWTSHNASICTGNIAGQWIGYDFSIMNGTVTVSSTATPSALSTSLVFYGGFGGGVTINDGMPSAANVRKNTVFGPPDAPQTGTLAAGAPSGGRLGIGL